MSQLILVRHGRTLANAEGRLLGRLDPPLDDLGRAQAESLADRLAPYLPTRVLTSPLVRCRATAETIAVHCDVPLEVEPRLVEVDYGEYDGVPVDEIPADVTQLWRTDPDFAPPGGESLASVGLRIAALADELLTELADDLVANTTTGPMIAVSHVSPIKAAVCWALGLPAVAAWRMRLDTASITRIAPGTAGPVLHSFNER